jgi:hypothetical protein
VFADDKGTTLSHAEMGLLGERVEDGSAVSSNVGRFGVSPFAKHLPYIELDFSCVIPVIHAMIWGVVKKIARMFLGNEPGCVSGINKLTSAAKNAITKNGDNIGVPHDISRGYMDIVKMSGEST